MNQDQIEAEIYILKLELSRVQNDLVQCSPSRFDHIQRRLHELYDMVEMVGRRRFEVVR